MSKLEYFDYYTKKLKWQITPVAASGKNPILESWNKRYKLEEVREIFEKSPDYNMGLCLGELVDVEADTLQANRVLSQLIGDCPHPQWKSNRSTHHLFRTPDPTLTKLIFCGIEFRGRLHQSLLPPSVVGDVKYRWVSSEVYAPDMPKSLLKFYWKHVRRYVRPISGMKVWCEECQTEFQGPENRIRLEIRAFRELNQKWRCRKCREDIRTACRQLKRK